MKKIFLIALLLTVSFWGRTQHIETSIKIVNGKARIVIKPVGGIITGQVSNACFGFAVPLKYAFLDMQDPTILDAARLPTFLTKIETYSDEKWKYFSLCFISPNSSVTYEQSKEYELLELNWKSNTGQNFPVALVSLGENRRLSSTSVNVITYFEVGGIQYSFGDRLFYQSTTSTAPVQMTKDYSTGTAWISTHDINSKSPMEKNVVRPSSYISLFPNPATNQVCVQVGYADNILLSVVDMYGRAVMQKMINTAVESSTSTLDVSSLPKGIYFIKLIGKSDDKPLVKKLVKL